jgi:hypothetical protein
VKIIVDTTVLVYAVGMEHALREPCLHPTSPAFNRLLAG